MVIGGLGDPGPRVIPRQGRRKEQGSVTIQHLLMVGNSVRDHQLRKFPVQLIVAVVPGDHGALVILTQESKKDQGPVIHLLMVVNLVQDPYLQDRKLSVQFQEDGMVCGEIGAQQNFVLLGVLFLASD